MNDLNKLFPIPAAEFRGRGPGDWTQGLPLAACARCGSAVVDQEQHRKWHRAVDSESTAVAGNDD